MLGLAAFAALILAVSPPVPVSAEPRLSAQQYLQVEDIYRTVVDGCCLRKEAARKVHLEIEQMVAAGQPQERIVAAFERRFKPLRAGQPVASVLPASLLAAIIGGVLVAAWFLVNETGRRLP
jgi:hypothetical protein